MIGSGDIVDPGEQVEITLTLTDLTPLLAEKIEITVTWPNGREKKEMVEVNTRVTVEMPAPEPEEHRH